MTDEWIVPKAEEKKEEKSMKEMVEELYKKQSEEIPGKKKKEKEFKIPWKARMRKMDLKKNKATMLYVDDNGEGKFMKVDIDTQTTMVDKIPRLARPHDMITYKGKPFIIQFAGSVEPVSPKKEYEAAVEKSMTTQGHRLLMNRMLSEAISLKKKIGMGAILIFGLIGIGVIYLISKGGLHF